MNTFKPGTKAEYQGRIYDANDPSLPAAARLIEREPSIYLVLRDGQPVDQTEEPMRWFHLNGPQSMEWQLTHEGYAIEGPFTEHQVAEWERQRQAGAEPLDQDCDCSHATVRRHPASQCTWDLAESRAELP